MKKNFIPAFSALAFFTFSLFAFFSCTTTKQTDTAQETAVSEIETPESNVQEELSAQRLIELGKIEEAKTLFSQATRKIDQACSKGVIVKNTAARKKSNLAKKLNAAQA